MSQYKTNLKLNILQEVSTCSYESCMKDLIVQYILDAMLYTKNPQQSKLCKKMLGKDTIILSSILMKCPFKEKIYDIPVHIYFMKNMPQEPPQFFVDLPNGKIINPSNKEIDKNTYKINTFTLTQWTVTSSIISAMNEIQDSFNRAFPICKSPDKSNINNQRAINNFNAYYNNNQAQFLSHRTNSSCTAPPNQSQISQKPQKSIADDWMIVTKSPIQSTPIITNVNQFNSTSLNVNSNINNNNNGNTNILNSISHAQLKNSTYQQLNELLKEVLFNEITTLIDQKLREEKKRIYQQNNRLMNYQNLLIIEEKKLGNYLAQGKNIKMASRQKLQEIDNELKSIQWYVDQNKIKQLTPKTCMDFVNLGNEENNVLISLIAREAMSEELLAMSKKSFERGSSTFEETMKFIRCETIDLFKLKYSREKMQKDH